MTGPNVLGLPMAGDRCRRCGGTRYRTLGPEALCRPCFERELADLAALRALQRDLWRQLWAAQAEVHRMWAQARQRWEVAA